MQDTDAALRQELTALEARVARLEGSSPDAPEVRNERKTARNHAPVDGGSTTSAKPTDVTQDDFWALTGLQAQRAEHPTTEDGIVMIVGSVTLPDGSPVAWQEATATADMFGEDWTGYAASFAALGHPVRLELMRHIMSGVHATAGLAEIASLGTTGQLHHHLRQLVAAGWVRQSGRGSYEVPVARMVPLLTSILGAQR